MSESSTESILEVLPWEQLPEEPKDVYLKFLEYARPLGSDYTTRRAFLIYQHEMENLGLPATERDSYAVWAIYARNYMWQERAHAWAAEQSKLYEAVYTRRRLQVAEQDWKTGRDLREFAGNVLHRMQTHEKGGKDEEGNTLVRVSFKPAEVSQMLKTAAELQRLAVGEPTQNIGLTQSGVSIYLPSNERPSNAAKESSSQPSN